MRTKETPVEDPKKLFPRPSQTFPRVHTKRGYAKRYCGALQPLHVKLLDIYCGVELHALSRTYPRPCLAHPCNTSRVSRILGQLNATDRAQGSQPASGGILVTRVEGISPQLFVQPRRSLLLPCEHRGPRRAVIGSGTGILPTRRHFLLHNTPQCGVE